MGKFMQSKLATLGLMVLVFTPALAVLFFRP